MLISCCLILIIIAGGFALTYLIERDEPFLWRAAAGCVIGCAFFGTSLFALAMIFGLNTVSIIAAMASTLLPILFIVKGERRKVFAHDWAKAAGKLQGTNLKKTFPFFYYATFLVLFAVFFDRVIFANEQGIFTGGSQNLGDLPFHLGIIFGFTDGANFPPINPSYAGAKLSYPFIPDLVTAAFIKLGAGVREAMLVQNVAWAFSLFVILERFVYRLLNDSLAAKIAPALLFLSGGLGFLWFFSDFGSQAKGFSDFLFSLPKDYTIGPDFRWGNSLVTLFITQRSLLLGMPITIIVLGFLWKRFATESREIKPKGSKSPQLHFSPTPFLVGLTAGLLPLIHLHSLFVLFIVVAFLFFMRFEKWREWLAFGMGVCVIAIPELIWTITGSATHAAEFFQFHFGWDAGETNILWFWLKNTGIFIPILIFGIYLTFKEKDRKEIAGRTFLLKFYLPFIFLFVLSNVAKLAPWEWDNIKVLIYWFVGSLPFAAFAIAWLWKKSNAFRIAAAVCFSILVFSGGLDVWRTVSRQINYKVFDADAAVVANRLKPTTKPHALFLNAPTFNTAIVLLGRGSLMRYPGHLSSHGIDYRQRESDVKQMYRGGPSALALMQKYAIEYVLISPEERNTLSPNEAFFSRFPVITESGQYKVYDVRNSE
ncbi:MAG: hypothetical protein ACRD6X_03795 [Pyrinomonadaceae bacterium]